MESRLEAFMESWLILLNKNPELRPKGVSRVLSQIAGEIVMHVAKKYVQQAADDYRFAQEKML